MPNEDWEVRDWAVYFGCTEDRLRIAAKAAGPLTKHVHAFLIRMAWIEQDRSDGIGGRVGRQPEAVDCGGARPIEGRPCPYV